MQPEPKSARGSGIDIRYFRWKGDGGPILCVHGLTANARCWDGVAAALAPAREILAMDLRGRGGSGRPDTGYSLLHHIADIRCLLDDLGIEKAALMGHSLGAFVSLAFSARYPERVDRLVLVDGGGHLSPEHMDKVMDGIRPALERLGKAFPTEADYLDAIRKTPSLHPWNPTIEACYRYEVENSADGFRCNIQPEHIAEEAGNLRKTDVRFFYPHVPCPTLVLRAARGLLSDDDILLPDDSIAAMLRDIPDARSVTVDGVNHYGIVFQTSPERYAALRGFLENA